MLSVTHRPRWPAVFEPVNSALPLKTVKSVGWTPADATPAMPLSSCVPPAVPSVVQSQVWPLALMPLNGASPPKTVRSAGATPAELAQAMDVSSTVPPAAPSDVHSRRRRSSRPLRTEPGRRAPLYRWAKARKNWPRGRQFKRPACRAVRLPQTAVIQCILGSKKNYIWQPAHPHIDGGRYGPHANGRPFARDRLHNLRVLVE
jgi:hypothetical protein